MSVDHEHQHAGEPHTGTLANRLNWLRAGVLGANDGIVSTAGIVVGVAAATADRAPVFTAGVAGLAAGAVDAGLSRGLVGVSGSTLVVNLASSRAAVRDGMATLTPLVGHVIAELSGLD